MRVLAVLAVAALLAGCAPAPAPPVEPPKPDPTTEPWYAATTTELAALNRDAAAFLQCRQLDRAADLIAKGQPLQSRLLSVPQPTLAATEAASDLDDLYGRMLLANRHVGWARLVFQKNLVRWKNWQPQTPDTLRRLDQAKAAIAECDRRLSSN